VKIWVVGICLRVCPVESWDVSDVEPRPSSRELVCGVR
jgi:hypothetical protein